MFNVTVLKMRDIKKYFFIMLAIIIGIMITSKYLPKVKKEQKVVEKLVARNNLIGCLEQAVPSLSKIKQEEKESIKEENVSETKLLQGILKMQVASMHEIEKLDSKIEDNQSLEKEIEEKEEQKEEVKIETAETGLNTQVITDNPIKETYHVEYGKVKIKNETEYELTEEMLKPDIIVENKNIVLFHTHSCESYTSSEQYPYVPTGNFRTTDINYSVTRVGTELENQLKQYNYNVVHDTSYHDYPAYNGSYTRSLATVENILKTTPSDIIMDVHRDAIGSRSDYAPTVKIGEEAAAQIMFVIGTNNGGLWHPNWNQNLKFAIKIQEKAEEMYPRIV